MDELRKTLAENKSSAKELDELARDVGTKLREAAEGSMKDATAKLGQASNGQRDAKPEDRDKTLESARSDQSRASNQLGSALERMSDIGSLSQTIEALQSLLEQQKKLGDQTRDIGQRNAGKTPEQMSKEDRDKLKDLSDQQKALADKTQKTIEQMNKSADQMEKSDPAGADAMRKAAKQGQRQNVSQNQRSASQQMQQNQQSKARQSQQQAELGLEVMLSELREAEKRKLAELQKKLAELQELINTLIRRQSGHNLDNLTLQGPDRLKAAGEELIKSLTEGRSATSRWNRARFVPSPSLAGSAPVRFRRNATPPTSRRRRPTCRTAPTPLPSSRAPARRWSGPSFTCARAS
ncbi:MAG: hypothetical protein QM770_13850 [Tepidisphaeraceae bacterium]